MQVQFHGAAREVTGSCHRVEVNGRHLLLDCGLIQGAAKDELRNRHALPFDARCIDAVVLSHAHVDHSGRLPLLVKAGFRGPILTHRATADLCKIMLRDAAYLNEREVEWENRKRERKGLPPIEPLYGVSDVERMLKQLQVLDYGVTHDIFPGATVTLHDAGHILGSAMVTLHLEEDGHRRCLVFSGDLGHRGTPILRDWQTLPHADLVLMESTYGDRDHRLWRDTWQEVRDVVREVRDAKGNILIPAFAVGRTQELLYLFGKYRREWELDRWRIILDSPLAIEATEIYTRHTELFDADAVPLMQQLHNGTLLPNLHFTERPEQSMQLNNVRSGAIIIAGSGMCTGGRIKQHLKHHIWRQETHIIIVGFQAEGTLGRALVNGAKHIRLWGETVRVAATVHTIGGLSAHADRSGLLSWYRGFQNSPPVALVHGEATAMSAMANHLTSLGAQVLQPDIGEVVNF